MAREGDKWRVVRGDCLWNIAKSVYGNPYKWTEIADANGVSRKTALIYPGNLLILPGITAGTTSGGAATPPSTPPSNKVTIKWWALDAGETRQMFCTWEHTKDNTAGYNVHVYYDTGQGGWRGPSTSTTPYGTKQWGGSVDQAAIKIRVCIQPYAETHEVNNQSVPYWTDGQWVEVEYDFRNNPPLLPDVPEVELRNNSNLFCSLSNIDPDINANQIEFAVYKDNSEKCYKRAKGDIISETRYVSALFENLDPGGSYTVRCRAIRDENIYSNWTDFTSPVKTIPLAPDEIITLRPQVISEQGAQQYGVFVEWTEVTSADNYRIEYTTNPIYFDTSGNVESIDTDPEQGNRYLITGMELGHEYYFRVCSLNETGHSGWTPIKSTKLGSRPSAPTTWSNTQNCEIGEDLKLYWVHNSTDGSLESIARLYIKTIDTAHPELPPMEIYKTIRNTRPEDDRNKISSYTINTDDPEWSYLTQGFIIKWKVQTAGVVEEYSEWSIEREVNVYLTPELTIDIKNQNGQSVDEISSFPFYINVMATPLAQIPISYYLEIVANQKYETIDDSGRKMVVDQGDRVYQKYYDPQQNPWEFIVEMTPGNLDLKSGISYTVNCTVAMNSSLTATNTSIFGVTWTESYYDVNADIILDKDTLEANIHPYCNEYEVDEQTGETIEVLTENCKLSVYRREYDGTYTLIASGIDNSENTYITDPHPSLDYARYRITATSDETGAISYGDIKPIRFGIPSFVVQWSEEWTRFEADGEDVEVPPYSGSMIKIPYNVDISESAKVDVTTIEYIGRKHPVSYYGTQLGESFTASVEIPRYDTALIYDLRRLSKYTGDVYVREPSGIGYWANISVQFSLNHNAVTVPVSFTITRVEGGI